ncbi:MAG: GNAT family N-acetyltransferase [Phycisphaeraceae bacterium JB051]
MNELPITITLADTNHWLGIWEIFSRVVASGQTYVYDPKTTCEQAKAIWLNPTAQARTYVLMRGEEILGTYLLKPNQPGLGNHVANAGYMIHPDAHRQGLGRMLAEHSFEMAKEMGFEAMQFNFVIATNHAAIHLWQSLGFEIVGRLPKVYRHATQGQVDALVMHRFL